MKRVPHILATTALALMSAAPVSGQLVIDFDGETHPFSHGTLSSDHSVSGSSSLYVGAGGSATVASFDLPAEYLSKDISITMQVLDLGRWVDSSVAGAPASVYGPRWGVGSGTDGASYVAAGLLHRSSLQSGDAYALHSPEQADDSLYSSWFSPTNYSGVPRAILSDDGGSNDGSAWVPGTPHPEGAWTEWVFDITADGEVTFHRTGFDSVTVTLGSPVTGIYLHGGRTISEAALEGVYFDDITVNIVKPLRESPTAAGATAHISRAVEAPVIDGEIDALWYDAYTFPISIEHTGTVESAADNSGRWHGLYTDERLYLLVGIADDYLTATDGMNPWDQDRIEVAFNMDNVKPNGGNGRTDDNYQYAFNWNMPDEQFGANQDWTGVEWVQVSTDTGWRVELSIPWSSLGIAPPVRGESFGMDIAISDNDGGELADSVLYWHNSGPALFGNIDGAGTVTMGGPTQTTIPLVSTAPTIDGERDTLWLAGGAEPIEVVQFGSVDSAKDLSAQWYGVHTNERFYFFVEISDDYLTSTDGEFVYLQDRIEVFFNMDNAKPNGGNGRTDDNFQYAFNWNLPDEQLGTANADWTGVEWAHATTDDGWTVEGSIPWSSLGVAPPSPGQAFGFDIAVNDNDGDLEHDSVTYWHNAAAALFGNIDGAGTIAMGDSFDGNYPPELEQPATHVAVAETASNIRVEASDANSGDMLSFSAPELPAFATLTDNGDGTATVGVNATEEQVGAYQFPVTVSDGVRSTTALLNILVQSASGPAAPAVSLIAGVSAIPGETHLVNIFVADTDSAHVEIAADDLPAFATLLDYRDGTARVTVKPTTTDVGSHEVTIVATDESENTHTTSFTITVLAPMDEAMIFFDVGNAVENFWIAVEDSIGWLYAEKYPWVYSYNHGWLYVYGSTGGFNAGSWFYYLAEGEFWYTWNSAYPWVWVHGEGWTTVSANTE